MIRLTSLPIWMPKWATLLVFDLSFSPFEYDVCWGKFVYFLFHSEFLSWMSARSFICFCASIDIFYWHGELCWLICICWKIVLSRCGILWLLFLYSQQMFFCVWFLIFRNCHKQFVRFWDFRTVKLQHQIQMLVKTRMPAWLLVLHHHFRVTPCLSMLPVEPETTTQHRYQCPQMSAD